MSVIVEDESNEIWLLTKGADSNMLSNCQITEEKMNGLNNDISFFAKVYTQTNVVKCSMLNN